MVKNVLARAYAICSPAVAAYHCLAPRNKQKIGRLPWFPIDFSWLNSRFPPSGKPPAIWPGFNLPKPAQPTPLAFFPSKIAVVTTGPGVNVRRSRSGPGQLWRDIQK